MSKYRAPIHFNVSQIRAAASCPRIFYFDTQLTRATKASSPCVTRIWESSGGKGVIAAAGSLFHNSIERFNRLAAQAEDVARVVEQAESSSSVQQGLLRYYNANCLNRASLAQKAPDTVVAFTQCVHRYMQELAEIVVYARSSGHSHSDVCSQLFGDRRKNVDVTFRVGAHEEAVHVTGRLDYVFYDWRCRNHRIVDYKLTPSDHPNNDQFQVVTYALMHHLQHGTEPDVAVFYLHPERRMVELSWEQVHARRQQVYDLLASMVEWTRFGTGEGEGLRPPGEIEYCATCRWDRDDHCRQSLGPKDHGERFSGWSAQQQSPQPVEPEIQVHEPADEAAPQPAHEHEDDPTDDGSAEAKCSAPELCLGGTADRTREPVGFSCATLNTHVAVVGAAGSGKTWMAKVLVEEAIRKQIPVLAVDPQGDLVQFLKPAAVDEIPPEWRAPFDEYWKVVEPRVFTPGSSHGTRICLNPLRLPRADDLKGIETEQRRAEELSGMLSSAANNLVSLASIGGETDSQRTLTFKILEAFSRQENDVGLSDVVSALIAPEGLGIENVDMIIKRTEREKFARKLYALAEGPSAGLFNQGQPLNLDELITPSQPGRVPLNVIYLNALHGDDQKQFFVSMLAAEIYRWMVTSLTATGEPNLLFYIDEARDYIPAGAFKPPAKEPLIRLFTQGRKYGVGCLLCTQSPRSVDYNVFGNCSTKLIGRMEAAQDVDRIADWFTTEGPVPSWVKDRKGAVKGTFAGRWPDIPTATEGRPFQSRMLFSLHEGAWSPERVEEECRKNRGTETP